MLPSDWSKVLWRHSTRNLNRGLYLPTPLLQRLSCRVSFTFTCIIIISQCEPGGHLNGRSQILTLVLLIKKCPNKNFIIIFFPYQKIKWIENLNIIVHNFSSILFKPNLVNWARLQKRVYYRQSHKKQTPKLSFTDITTKWQSHFHGGFKVTKWFRISF